MVGDTCMSDTTRDGSVDQAAEFARGAVGSGEISCVGSEEALFAAAICDGKRRVMSLPLAKLDRM